MFTKTNIELGEKSGVHYAQSFVSFGPVKLNAYCFEVDGILIDSGAQSVLTDLKPFFEEADFDQLYLTHNHEDHTGGAAFLQQTYDIPVFINEISVNDCKQVANYPQYRKLFWGKRKPFEAKPIGKTFSSRHATWDVITTPGHTKDHLSFLNRSTKQLFSGDLYVHPKPKVIMPNEDIPTIIASLEKMLTYDFEEMFCCHAGYIKDGRKALEDKLAYLTSLQEEVLDLYEQGWKEKDIRKKIFPKRYPITYFSFGDWDSKHIIRTILS